MKDTILNGAEIEKPTAVVYYQNIINKNKLVNLNPTLIKNKVRNLKEQYNKAVTWLNGTGMGLINDKDGKTVEEYIHKICPFWDLLDEIYNQNVGIHLPPILDSLDDGETHSIQQEASAEEPVDELELLQEESEEVADVEEIILVEERNENVALPAEDICLNGFKRKLNQNDKWKPKKQTKTTLESLNDLNKIRSDIQNSKLEVEKEKLEFQKHQWNQQLELEREKIASAEKLEIMRIEKEERIAKFEIECKFRYQTK
ncbi:unnamed protein product [Phaedon cochleariae]|uniref:Uncharacterized protein n=1 Tax=Phaedon cochleariae TaxID=80249 RepID=A0A9N9X456_PHACE|nr:unnamed protein product [Phaedon cochleariae]